MHKIKQTSVLPILVILIAVPLAAASPGNYPLHEAIRYSDLDRLTGLLQAGHDPDQADELGRTALHCALARLHGRGYLYVSEPLRFGADPNLPLGGGLSPLSSAYITGHMDIARLLENHGARVPSAAKKLQLQAVGVITAAIRISAKERTGGESLRRAQARIARIMRDKYGLHHQLSDDQIRRIALEESSPQAEESN